MKAFFKAERIWILTQKPGRLSGVSVKICDLSSIPGVLEKQMAEEYQPRAGGCLLEEFSSTSFNDHNNHALAVAVAAAAQNII